MVTCWYRTAREESANIVWWQVACMLAWRPTHARARARMTACVRAHSDSAAQRRRSLADVCGSQAMNIQEDGSAVQHPLPPPAWLARCLRAHIRQVDPVPPPPPPIIQPIIVTNWRRHLSTAAQIQRQTAEFARWFTKQTPPIPRTWSQRNIQYSVIRIWYRQKP